MSCEVLYILFYLLQCFGQITLARSMDSLFWAYLWIAYPFPNLLDCYDFIVDNYTGKKMYAVTFTAQFQNIRWVIQ